MKNGKVISIVTIAIKKNEKFLLLKDNKRDVWRFPSKKFDENLNGNLDDTVKRMLGAIIDLKREEIDYLGSFLRKKNNRIFIGYNFLIEEFESNILPKVYKWGAREEIENIKLDKNTSTFLKLHSDLI